MALPTKMGAHWALIETQPISDGSPLWKARWALYKDETTATLAETPDPQWAVVSGSTAVFDTQGEALLRGEVDAARSEAVLSGTYRQ